MKLVIIKYNAGNTRSLAFALQRMGIEPIISDDETSIREADKVIIPGVGEASSAMHYLRQKGLDALIKQLQQPVLGICLGMQLLCAQTEEGNTDGLGIFKTQVEKFKSGKVPHMGWNTVATSGSRLLQGIQDESFFYFVHSFYSTIGEETSATTNYQIPFSSCLENKNFYGVQFHPEKSAENGELLLKNFLSL